MSTRVIIIAEAGVNHNGSLEIAKKMIGTAALAGADFIKFQTFKADKLVSRSARKALYQLSNTPGEDESQLEMLRRLELDEEQHRELMHEANRKGIQFLSTGFDEESVDFLHQLGVTLFKIPSGEITNKPYLKHIAKIHKPVFLSTGMSTMKEVQDALLVLTENGLDRDMITLLHCTTEYPAPITEVNLKAMASMSSFFNVKVGYSDHTAGIEVPIAAVAMGASVIEKHFTLDRNMAGPDHKASLEPNELKIMIESIRKVEEALGDGIKKPSFSELKNREAARKSIVASRFIRKGELLSGANLSVKRPGTGISPMHWDEVTGNEAKKDFAPDELIEL